MGPGPERLDALVIGGGAAGRSAALLMGRARRQVAVVDSGQPSNAVSTGIGGFLGQDQRDPGEFYEDTRAELARYPTVAWHHGTVDRLQPSADSGWTATLDDGSAVDAAHVVLAMGMHYDVPAIPGIEPLWGASVFHCPFCHGWEHRDEPLLLSAADAPEVVRPALLLQNWSRDVTVIAPPGALTDDQRDLLKEAGMAVVEGAIARLHGQGRQLRGAELDDGTVVPARGMMVPAPHRQRSALVDGLGLEIDDSGHVVVDEYGRTGVDGLWAVGDLTSPMAMVARATGAGAVTAAWIVHHLVLDGRVDLP